MASSVDNASRYTQTQFYAVSETSPNDHHAKRPYPSLLEIRQASNLTVEELTQIKIAVKADIKAMENKIGTGSLHHIWRERGADLAESKAILLEVQNRLS